MLYLICYDIPSDRRRRKAADILLDFGGRVQESTFECDLRTEARRRDLERRLERLLDPTEDSLRIYRVCAACAAAQARFGIDSTPVPLPRTLIL